MLLMFSPLHPSFFPSIKLFLARLVILLIASRGIQAVNPVKCWTFKRTLERNGSQWLLSFLIWRDSARWTGSSLTLPFRNRFAAAFLSATHSGRHVRKTLSSYHCPIVTIATDVMWNPPLYCENNVGWKLALGKLQRTGDLIWSTLLAGSFLY